jgi:hypothetical protein
MQVVEEAGMAVEKDSDDEGRLERIKLRSKRAGEETWQGEPIYFLNLTRC